MVQLPIVVTDGCYAKPVIPLMITLYAATGDSQDAACVVLSPSHKELRSAKMGIPYEQTAAQPEALHIHTVGLAHPASVAAHATCTAPAQSKGGTVSTTLFCIVMHFHWGHPSNQDLA